jgi:hypothetical protein
MEKIRIRDGKNSDPGWKKFGSGMKKIRIRDKLAGSATMIQTFTLMEIYAGNGSFYQGRVILG